MAKDWRWLTHVALKNDHVSALLCWIEGPAPLPMPALRPRTVRPGFTPGRQVEPAQVT